MLSVAENMIDEIINEFKQKFNTFADTTDAFSSRFIRDEDSAIATLCFNRFNVEFEYCLDCGGEIAKSGLNIIIDFSKRSEMPLKCMMYDLIGLIDENNFSCWFYCFIESRERMALCFDKLSGDFNAVLPKIKSLAESDESEKKITEILKTNIKNMIGIDFVKYIYEESQVGDGIDLDEVCEYVYSVYFGFEQCAFSSYEYRDFLSGDRKKALKRYEKKKNRLIYEEKIIDYLRHTEDPKAVLSEEYECLRDGLREYSGTSGFVPYFASCGLLLIPFLILCMGMYYAVSSIMYGSAIYSSALEWYNAVCCIIPALFCSFSAAYFLKERIYRRLFKRRFEKMKNYDAVFESEKSKKRTRIILYLFYILALLFVFLSANKGVSLYETGINVNRHYFDIKGSFYSYSEAACVKTTSDDGSNTYEIRMTNGESIDLDSYVDFEDIENKLIPLFENFGVEIQNDTE